MRAVEVFTPNRLPKVTFVEDHLVAKTTFLRQSLETGGGVISLSGPSKSGKTVFIENALGRGDLLQVTGAGVDSPDKLWDRVFELTGTPTKTVRTEGSSVAAGATGKLAGGIPLALTGEVAASGTWTKNSTAAAEQKPDYLQLLISELAGSGFVVFIDDFHYIPRPVQIEVANQIKEAIRAGVQFICAAVPYHSDDVLRANPDLRGRIFNIDFNYWNENELKKIAQRGFDALNIEMSDAMISAFASEAAGSPQLMQSLCLTACFELGHTERTATRAKVTADPPLIDRVCTRTAATADYSSTVNRMRDGPKTRGTERKSHLLRDSRVLDVYPLILEAIAENPPELTIRYANLQARIGRLCAADAPSGSSVTGACAHMSDIANAADNRIVAEWDGANDVFDIRDPYLLFYLRWGDWR